MRDFTAKQIGDTYEEMACTFLLNQGLQIITRNYHVAQIGEIDIVAYESRQLPNGKNLQTLVFVEVKARTHNRYATASASVTKSKQQRLVRSAGHFLQTHEQFAGYDCRFDVLAFDIYQGQTQIQWIPAAFLAQV